MDDTPVLVVSASATRYVIYIFIFLLELTKLEIDLNSEPLAVCVAGNSYWTGYAELTWQSASALLSLQKMWFMDTDLWRCPHN